VVTAAALKKLFGGRDAVPVLSHLAILEVLPRERKQWQKFRLLVDLPTGEQFAEMERTMYTTTVGALVEDAFCEFETLQGEMDDWYSNLPEQFQQGDKGQALEEASGMLGGLNRSDIPQVAEGLTVFFRPGQGLGSRSARCEEACAMLNAAKRAVEEQVAKLEEDDELNESINDLNAFADELEGAAGEAEGVEFPGMFS